MLRISWTALTACSTSGNWAIATLIGTTGANRKVAMINISKTIHTYTTVDITFCDDAQRPLGTNEQLRGIEAYSRLPGPSPCLDHLAIR